MASNFDDFSKWRLRTPKGVPYKFIKMEGEFEQVSGNVSVDVMVPSSQLKDFMTELLPSYLTVVVGAVKGVPVSIVVPQYSTFGNFNLRVKKIGFRSYDDSLPIDPFGFDMVPVLDGSGNPITSETGNPVTQQQPGTYAGVVRCTIFYEPPQFGNGTASDPTNPNSYLEVRASATGEFLHTTPQFVTWQNLKASTDPKKPDPVADGKAKPNRSENIPATILAPQTSYIVKWNMIPYSYFVGTIKPQLELGLGRVNSKAFPLVFMKDAKTVLFTGYDFDYSFSWNFNYTDVPLIDLTMKFLVKRILWGNYQRNDDGSIKTTKDSATGNKVPVLDPPIVRGHCDFWKPGEGWSRLLVNGREVYDTYDLNFVINPASILGG